MGWKGKDDVPRGPQRLDGFWKVKPHGREDRLNIESAAGPPPKTQRATDKRCQDD
jgi:hypothetical protein